jgi:DNA-binding transcriptional LysR family regulator
MKDIPQTGCHADGAATARCMPAADAMWSDLWHKPHMEMHQVRYFLAMTRSLNFTRAAEECNVTQPSLTRAIQKLEEEFGGPLFRRERSRTHLTDLGREILPLFETAYEAAQAAKNLAREIGKAQVAPLTLGIANTIENDDLHVLLGEIGAHLPGFELTLQSGSSEEMIGLGLNGALDLFVVEAPEDAPDRFEAWSLFDHVYHMITRAEHPLASRDVVTLDDVRDEVWIEYCDGGARALRDAAKTAGFEPAFRHRVDSMVYLRRLVSAGLGSAFLPPPRDRTKLAVLRLVGVEVSRNVVLAAIAGRRRSVAADALVRAARARAWNVELSAGQ